MDDRLGVGDLKGLPACFAEPFAEAGLGLAKPAPAPVNACILAPSSGRRWNSAIGSVATRPQLRPAGSRTGCLACDSPMRSWRNRCRKFGRG
jgi:hypothetical protein